MPPATAPEVEISDADDPNAQADKARRNEKYNVPFDDARVVKYGEAGGAVLRRVADEICFVDTHVRTLIRDMGDIMYNAHGVGLAAPQVGESIRLLVYDAGEGFRALINPVILKRKGEQTEPEEGCLSIPGLRGIVRRANDITVRGLDGEGRPVRFRATGFEARILQHEIDHLNGILFIDLVEKDSLHMLSPQEEAEDEEFAPSASSAVAPAE